MAYITKFDGKTDTTINLGNKDSSTSNPTSVEGYFLGTKDVPDNGYGAGKLHMFQTKAGVVGVWGKANSNRLMTPDLVGNMCLLKFTGMGEKRKGKNPAYEYSLQYDKDNTTDTSGVDLTYHNPESDIDNDEDNGEDVTIEDQQAKIRAALKARNNR